MAAIPEENAMDIPVLIQPIPGKGFVASAPCFGWSAEGPTAEAAVAMLQIEANKCMACGCKVGTIRVADAASGVSQLNGGVHPSLAFAGSLNLNDPNTQIWLEEMEKFRREVDAADAADLAAEGDVQ